MAEKMNGDVQLAAARKVAWNALKRCIPGREELNMDFCHGLPGRRGERQSLDPASGLG